MGKINVLDSSVYNVIAAGEVVERPASIVKELIENSIDAGATAVTVEIENGGIDLIRVTDNGCGIEPDDVPKAFLAHATSKIRTAADLDGIGTLGFRGEALASIAAVSDVTLLSRTPGAELGYGIVCRNGKIVDQGERGCPFGTTVTVRDVFGRIPARRKFLAKPHTEEAEISNLISRIVLADYNVSIKYTADGKTVLMSPGKDMESAIYTVYGREFSENITKVAYSLSDIALRGYICKPYFTKHNRSFQTLIVNGRYVINGDVSFQIYDCYKDFLMKRQFPAYVLYLDLPLDMVDVNVHPNKLDVKFAAPQLIKRIVRDAVKEVLQGSAREVKPLAQEPAAVPDDSFRTVTPDDGPDGAWPSAKESLTRATTDKAEPVRLHEKPRGFSPSFLTESAPAPSSVPDTPAFAPPSSVTVQSHAAENKTHGAKQKTAQIDFELFGTPAYKIRGVLFDTYVLAECGDHVYFIDQHAAHEKLLYDRLVASVESGGVSAQNLLIPYAFDVTYGDGEILSEHLDAFAACGFDIEKKTDASFVLKAVPAVCTGLNIKDFLYNLLSDMENGRRQTDFIKESLMQAACKAAVKGEDRLSEGELNKLIRDISEANITLYCPHGRPIAVRVDRAELEKWFKRTV